MYRASAMLLTALFILSSLFIAVQASAENYNIHIVHNDDYIASQGGLHFDGVNDYVKVNTSATLTSNWANSGEWTAIIYTNIHKSGFNKLFNGKFHDPRLFVENDRSFGLVGMINGTYTTILTATVDTTLGRNMFAWLQSESGGYSKLYYNGNLAASGKYEKIDGGVKYYLIGDNDWEAPLYDNKEIYFVALYNRALNDTEISEIYNYIKYGNGTIPQQNLTLLFTPQSIDYQNGIWKDESGNGNNGQLNGTDLIPAAPKNLIGQFAGDKLRLSWNAVAGAEYYKIYKSTDGKKYTLIGSTNYTYYDADIPFYQAYYYVTAVSIGRNNTTVESVPSWNIIHVSDGAAAGWVIDNMTHIQLWQYIAAAIFVVYLMLYVAENRKRRR